MNVEFPIELSGAKSSTLMWAQEHEVGAQALQQLRNIAALPWVHGVRVMPDVHLGKGATVGSVIAMTQAVSPAAVGVDIGCGMEGVLTSLTAADLPDDLSAIRSRIEAAVPVGFRAHEDPVSVRKLGLDRGWDRFWGSFSSLHDGVQDREKKAQQQMGSLGGGNHFIEVCLDDEDRVWLMLHSGSRNIGKELAERHMRIARTLPHNADLPDRDLAVFLSGTPEMDAYRRDLTWAQEYASRNRAVMLALVMRAVRESFAQEVRFEQPISCHHNYVAEEHIDGLDLLVTRKGAIRAGRGRPRADPRVDGHRVVRRPRARHGAVLLLGLARGRPADEPQRGEAPVHGRRPDRPDRRGRVPQGRRCGRRDSRRVQGHRVRHRGPVGPGRGRSPPQAGHLCEGIAVRRPPSSGETAAAGSG